MTEQVSSSTALELLSRELKNARIEKNLSLEDVSRLTSVQKNHLEKIEEGDFSFLPKAYIFSFIKEYAILMGVGNDETFEQCKKELQFASAYKRDVSTESNTKKQKKTPDWMTNFRDVRLPKSSWFIIGIVFVVVTGLSFFFFNRKHHSSTPHSPAPHSPSAVSLPSATGEDTVAVAEQIVDSLQVPGLNKPPLNVPSSSSHQPTPTRADSVATSASSRAPVPSASVVSAPPAASNSREWAKNVSFLPSPSSSPYRKVLVVRLVEDLSWVKVIADDSSRVYPGGKFKNGQVLRFEARKNYWVNIGRPKYVELYLNGKKLPPTTDRILIIR